MEGPEPSAVQLRPRPSSETSRAAIACNSEMSTSETLLIMGLHRGFTGLYKGYIEVYRGHIG